MLQLYRPVPKETKKGLLFEVITSKWYGEQYYSSTLKMSHRVGAWTRNFDAVENQYNWVVHNIYNG